MGVVVTRFGLLLPSPVATATVLLPLLPAVLVVHYGPLLVHHFTPLRPVMVALLFGALVLGTLDPRFNNNPLRSLAE